MYLLKKIGLPWMPWILMLRGNIAVVPTLIWGALSRASTSRTSGQPRLSRPPTSSDGLQPLLLHDIQVHPVL